ncbi:MAG: S41 family peptidase [Pseudomonadota bacterium]
MKRISVLFVTAFLTACGGGGGGGAQAPAPTTPPVSNDPCSITGQNQFVLDVMNDWYFWNDLLPTDVNVGNYASPEELLGFLTSFQPVDRFSFIGSAAADSAFFGEGQFEGYGFRYRFVADNTPQLLLVYEDGPAFRAGLRRGQVFVALNGRSIADIQANEGISAIFDLPSVDVTMRNLDNSEFTVTMTEDIVTIDPVPQFRIIDAGAGRSVGYLELTTFISTANGQMDEAINQFRINGVTEVILDLRYNGGGLVSTANLLGDLLGGGNFDTLEFSETRFNADRAAAQNNAEFFERRTGSMNLERMVVIASRGTASASELVTNSMDAYVTLGIVGDRTFGKPVGQSGFTFCEKILRPTTFETVNALDFGDYFNGLPANCNAADDPAIPVGDDTDPNIVAALQFLEDQSCPPVTSTPDASSKPFGGEFGEFEQPLYRPGPPHRELLDSY